MLRAHHEGVLAFDERFAALRFVLDSADGRPVCPASAAVFESESVSLLVPEEADDALQLLAMPHEIDPRTHPAADKFLAYHGRPAEIRFAALELVAARFHGEILDGEELQIPNPLAADEPRLCRDLNAERDALAALCRRRTGKGSPAPVAVGVDPMGFDVRLSFGVLRIEFDAATADARDAASRIAALLGRPSP